MTVIALPDIAADLNFSAEAILWVNIIYLMSFVAFSLPFAKIISQYGVKKSTKISLLLLFFSILISVFSINDIMFLLSRLMQGFSAAIIYWIVNCSSSYGIGNCCIRLEMGIFNGTPNISYSADIIEWN